MKKFSALLAILTIMLASGCFPLNAPIDAVVPAGSSLPVVTTLYANPPVITTGQSSNLVWTVTNATTVTINPGLGTVEPSGSLSVTPSSMTTYTLIASNGNGSTTSTAIVTVNPMTSPPVITSFTANSTFINPGQTTYLTWSTTGADSVRIDPSFGNVSASGSQAVSPGYTTTYILTAAGSAGVITQTVNVSVSTYPTCTTSSPVCPPYPVYQPYTGAGSLPAVISFAINPPVIAPGEPATMMWDVSGADTVTISPGVGTVPATGYMVISPSETTYYTLVASNVYGPSSASALVTVYPLNYYSYTSPTPPLFETPAFERSEKGEQPGETMPETQNPPPPVKTPPSPPVTKPPPGDGKTLPRIESFTSSTQSVEVGNSSQLQWKVNGATSVHISPDIGPVSPSGTTTVSPSHTTVYTITASNSAGVVQHPQEITVPRTLPSKKPNQ
ncbi:MAG: hypothetical protein ABSA18_13365 [Dehalococcoidia bacterium]|jgi:hypothetical protein